ncbi:MULTISPECIES: hypothetical protein [unclassified Nocardiopsis]|uniref:hypothetical protein n=1 Tax=unclassified Nocardiopsis TaxID=2649073 RepID=UPI0033DB870E
MESSEQQRKLVDIGRLVLAEAPEGWKRIEVIFSCLSELSAASVVIVTEDGERTTGELSLQASGELRDLRDLMHEPTRGTWFSLHYTITRPGSFHVDFNYDDEPPFPYPLDPERFANDYFRFPREREHIPSWLFAKFREVKNRDQVTGEPDQRRR